MSDLPVEMSLVVPAFNEESRLPPSLAVIRGVLDEAARSYEVIVVDDGSRDRTADLVEEARLSWPELQLIVFERNQGKGAAVRAGACVCSAMPTYPPRWRRCGNWRPQSAPGPGSRSDRARFRVRRSNCTNPGIVS